jgi:hypothetical protein
MRGENLRFCLMGADQDGKKRQPNRGDHEVMRFWATQKLGVPTHPGVVYWQIDQSPTRMISGASKLIVEFNPAKLTRGDLHLVAGGLKTLAGASRVVVERYDFAMDYALPRGLLTLDDRGREMDCFGVGVSGPQTERTGFRKGSKLKLQLYDKRAELAVRGVTLDEDRARFEVQVLGRPDGDVFLDELESQPCPLGSATVRAFNFDPATIFDESFALAALAVRGNGMRTVLATLRRMGWRKSRRDQFEACVVREVDPSPSQLWASHFRDSVRSVVGHLLGEDGRPLLTPYVVKPEPGTGKLVVDWGSFGGDASSERPASEPRSDPSEAAL